MLRVPRHFPHDDHLRFQQRSDGVVARDGGAVVGEDDAHLGLVVGWDVVVEGLGGEVTSVCAVSGVVMILRMVLISQGRAVTLMETQDTSTWCLMSYRDLDR